MIRAIAMSFLLAVPAAAQTFEEAVRINTSVAISTCLSVMIDRAVPDTAFGAAGFSYRAIDRGVNDYNVALGLDHYFDAPAETVKAEVDRPDGVAGICMVLTTHLDQADLNEIVAATMFQDHPGAQVRDENQWSINTPSGLPLIVSTRTITDNHRYEPPGTVTVSMSFPG